MENIVFNVKIPALTFIREFAESNKRENVECFISIFKVLQVLTSPATVYLSSKVDRP